MYIWEEIISGLECHAERRCFECPFWQIGCTKALFNRTIGFIRNQGKQANEAYSNGVKALAEQIKAVDGNEYLESCYDRGEYSVEFRQDWLEERVDYLVRKLLEGNR